MTDSARFNRYFKGNSPTPSKQGWKNLPKRKDFTRPQGYIAQPGLIDAVNVALALGQPLLLTGEPGTGKSTLASNIAFELGCEDTDLKVEIKSTTTARELFYTFDHIGWFNSRTVSDTPPTPSRFIAYTGLGKALLVAADKVPQALIPKDMHIGEQRRSVVLIDEIDKAPRDVPNDLLNEIEHMYFKVPEIDNTEIAANPAYRPIIVITSNSEKVLPDAFLRRCIFYNIEFPEPDTLMQILLSRFSDDDNVHPQLLEDAASLLRHLRASPDLDKKPGLSEIIEFVEVLSPFADARQGLRTQKDLIMAKMSTLLKNRFPHGRKEQLIADWLNTTG
ncbi:AAA family ATPase [Alteromonas halophila]|uniref:ATPase n=1 Tax=Alteromonas halophila TaxID=516698 RepID=A0A918JND6_9ALTE|nr:MoxR family ATPase [Alteromonas halophila]GGW92267.1 ATPase [Alteromonas halophila]